MIHNKIEEFPPVVRKKIGYYVYYLTEPGKTKPFYIGKGKGNRIFQHAKGKIKSKAKSEKIAIIKNILKRGEWPVLQILRHRLNEQEALAIESALIDYVGLDKLSNKVRGYRSEENGKMPIEQIITIYDADEIKVIEHPVIAININKNFEYGMSRNKLYKATRSAWVLRKDINEANVKYALSVCWGIVWEVYAIKKWKKRKDGRWVFYGKPANDEIGEKYRLKYLPKKYREKGAQNPIRYIGCK